MLEEIYAEVKDQNIQEVRGEVKEANLETYNSELKEILESVDIDQEIIDKL